MPSLPVLNYSNTKLTSHSIYLPQSIDVYFINLLAPISQLPCLVLIILHHAFFFPYHKCYELKMSLSFFIQSRLCNW